VKPSWIFEFFIARKNEDRLGFFVLRISPIMAQAGSEKQAANPDPHEYQLDYTPKIKLLKKRSPSGGGCG